jgi:D-alanine-D-alanine ligase
MPKLNIAIVTGGSSSERDISLVTAGRVLDNLDNTRYHGYLVDSSDRSALESLVNSPPDVAFVAQHGRGGEDGAVQGFLETLGIPYTGSGVLASALAMDKLRCKEFLKGHRITMPGHAAFYSGCGFEQLAGANTSQLPLIVKPSGSGSSDGLTVVRDRASLAPALNAAFAFDSCVLVEEFIPGVEITGAVLGNDVLEPLPLIEIVPAKGIYDREAKYTPGATDEICPARLSPAVTTRAQELAQRCHRALGCRGMSRTDMMVTPSGEVYFIELNTIPGMTPTSLLPRAAQEAGYSFSQLLDRIIGLAMET